MCKSRANKFISIKKQRLFNKIRAREWIYDKKKNKKNKLKLIFCCFLWNFQNDGNGDPNEVQLDAEMEKVFAGVENQDKFDVSKLSDQQQQSTESKNDSEDYDGMYFLDIEL